MTQEHDKEGETIAEALVGILGHLSVAQMRFVVARQDCATDKEAAEAIGFPPNTIAKWKCAGVPIALAVRLMAEDGLVMARTIRRKALAKAMLIKTAGLDDENPRIAQSVATEIIEWEMGKATQYSELTGKGGDPLFDLAEWERKRQERIDGLCKPE